MEQNEMEQNGKSVLCEMGKSVLCETGISILCEMEICTLRYENLYFAKRKTTLRNVNMTKGKMNH